MEKTLNYIINDQVRINTNLSPCCNHLNINLRTQSASWKPRVRFYSHRKLEKQFNVSKKLNRAPFRRRCISPVSVLPESLLVHLPEVGPLRDLAFTIIGASAALTLSAAVAWAWQREEVKLRASAAERGKAALPETSSSASQKESVEWVNMVVQKIWRIYRRSLESWLVGLLQPAIDKLPKPDYVTRVEIAEFCLNEEPISLRNVQRRASRRVNDLQYHIGLRYTGGATCLLVLHVNKGGFSTQIPVGVHDLDVDGEMWVKLRLTRRKPFVGTLSIAFVKLPTIKLVLAPFRVFNLFAVPFLSRFLSKLLTVDLPRLIVLPRHITFDFMPSGVDFNQSGPTPSVVDVAAMDPPSSGSSSAHSDMSENFIGELTVTLCEARNLPTWGFSGLSNPYCILTIDGRSIESKRNSETSHPSGARDPVWNQDFQFLIEDPLRQKLTVRIRDSNITLHPDIGFVQIPIWQLQDCVPVTVWSPLLFDGPLGVKQVPGELRLLLTYKSYVDRENDADVRNLQVPYIKVFGEGEESDSDKLTESDSDGTGLFVLQGTEPASDRNGPVEDQKPQTESSSGKIPETAAVGQESAVVAKPDWRGAVVSHVVGGVSKGGSWVAKKTVFLWQRISNRKEETSGAEFEELSGPEMSAERKIEEGLQKAQEEMMKEIEQGQAAEAIFTSVHTSVASDGNHPETTQKAHSNGSTHGRPEQAPKGPQPPPEKEKRAAVNGSSFQSSVNGHSFDTAGVLSSSEAEEMDGLLKSIAGEIMELKFVPRAESELSADDDPRSAEGGAGSEGGEGPAAEGKELAEAFERSILKEAMNAAEDLNARVNTEMLLEVSRTGALNKAIMELIDLFDKQGG